MARKKIEPIVSLGNEDKLTVQKSLPLFALWRSELSLAEFKILDTYLSRINSHDDKHRTVVFEKGELEKMLGVTQIKAKDLDKRLRHLMTTVQLPNEKGFTRIALFEKAVAQPDDYGQWSVELTCTESAKKYIFNIEALGYLRYKLRCITSITSRYTYIMFIYLEANRFRKSWEVSLGELKKILNCEGVVTYATFKEFNKQVLKRTQTEMHEKTECRYSYEPIKKGRSVVAVRFSLESNALFVAPEDPDQITIDDWMAAGPEEIKVEPWQKKLAQRFSPAEVEALSAMVMSLPVYVLPPETDAFDSIPLRRSRYLKIKMAAMDVHSPKKPYNYLLSLIQQDLERS